MTGPRMDKIDRRILEILQSDGRIAIVDLATRVNLSPTPCAVRVKRLESDGIITGYGARVDREKIDLGIMAIVLIKIKENTKEAGDSFLKSVQSSAAIDKCFMTIGRIDYIAHVYAKDLQGLEDLLRKDVASLPHILSMETVLVLKSDFK